MDNITFGGGRSNALSTYATEIEEFQSACLAATDDGVAIEARSPLLYAALEKLQDSSTLHIADIYPGIPSITPPASAPANASAMDLVVSDLSSLSFLGVREHLHEECRNFTEGQTTFARAPKT